MAVPGKVPAGFSYPKARRDETVIDDYHGTKIADPYVWLEDPDSEKTKAFVEEQNAITMPYLADCEIRENFKTRSAIGFQPYNLKVEYKVIFLVLLFLSNWK